MIEQFGEISMLVERIHNDSQCVLTNLKFLRNFNLDHRHLMSPNKWTLVQRRSSSEGFSPNPNWTPNLDYSSLSSVRHGMSRENEDIKNGNLIHFWYFLILFNKRLYCRTDWAPERVNNESEREAFPFFRKSLKFSDWTLGWICLNGNYS